MFRCLQTIILRTVQKKKSHKVVNRLVLIKKTMSLIDNNYLYVDDKLSLVFNKEDLYG